ncbi:MAG: hypothetical protein FJ280_25895, partial [Planctomycetes bacterium]|nr:hypothetical protein [Planctomycetota bacterium]
MRPSTVKIIHSFLFILLTLLLLTGCKRRDDQAVVIGVVAPLTGDGATYGASMRRGFDLAFQHEPSVRLIYEDSKFSPREGVSAINKLISADKVQVVLGEAASGVTLAMAPVAERNRVILFSSISTSDNLRTAGQYIFRNVPRNEIQGVSGEHYGFVGEKVVWKKTFESSIKTVVFCLGGKEF